MLPLGGGSCPDKEAPPDALEADQDHFLLSMLEGDVWVGGGGRKVCDEWARVTDVRGGAKCLRLDGRLRRCLAVVDTLFPGSTNALAARSCRARQHCALPYVDLRMTSGRANSRLRLRVVWEGQRDTDREEQKGREGGRATV